MAKIVGCPSNARNMDELHMVLRLLRGGKSPIWWTFYENAFYYCSALSDPFGNLKYAPTKSGTHTSNGINLVLNGFIFGCLPYIHSIHYA